MSEIKIFMCCHNRYEKVPPLCEPIQCGAALNSKMSGTVYDDSGDNISQKNREYCELTAHYYAWKNVCADYYGFCHYRRFFAVKGRTKHPYIAKGKLSENANKLLGTEIDLREIIESCEVVAPENEDMGLPVREHYCTSANHYAEDLTLFLEILNEKAPNLIKTAEKYLSQNKQYFCNMFIMSRERFFEYCETLFPILEEFDRRKTLHGDFQSDRTDGYLGEIFTGIFISHYEKEGRKIKKLPRLDINCSLKKRLGWALLPPESKRRFCAKKIVKLFRRK